MNLSTIISTYWSRWIHSCISPNLCTYRLSTNHHSPYLPISPKSHLQIIHEYYRPHHPSYLPTNLLTQFISTNHLAYLSPYWTTFHPLYWPILRSPNWPNTYLITSYLQSYHVSFSLSSILPTNQPQFSNQNNLPIILYLTLLSVLPTDIAFVFQTDLPTY